jgi:hypothetical protein
MAKKERPKLILTDRDELKKRLEVLEEISAEREDFNGVRCYAPPRGPDNVHTCPKCGKETPLYNLRDHTIKTIAGIVKEIQSAGYDAILDESELCWHCVNPDFPEAPSGAFMPELVFKIRYDANSEYHVARSNVIEHYKCVLAFLEDAGHYYSDINSTQVLDREIGVLRKMLGPGVNIAAKFIEAFNKKFLETRLKQRSAGK